MVRILSPLHSCSCAESQITATEHIEVLTLSSSVSSGADFSSSVSISGESKEAITVPVTASGFMDDFESKEAITAPVTASGFMDDFESDDDSSDAQAVKLSARDLGNRLRATRLKTRRGRLASNSNDEDSFCGMQ